MCVGEGMDYDNYCSSSASFFVPSFLLSPSSSPSFPLSPPSPSSPLFPPSPSLPSVYEAMESYVPQNEDEVGFMTGDKIEVLSKSMDGWWKIRCVVLVFVWGGSSGEGRGRGGGGGWRRGVYLVDCYCVC